MKGRFISAKKLPLFSVMLLPVEWEMYVVFNEKKIEWQMTRMMCFLLSPASMLQSYITIVKMKKGCILTSLICHFKADPIIKLCKAPMVKAW